MTLVFRRPWERGEPSLLEFIEARLSEVGDDVMREALPDEENAQDEIRWMPGALDGVGARHMHPDEAEPSLEEMVTALRRAAPDRRGRRGRLRLYELARSGRALPLVDALLERLRVLGITTATLLPSARWLAFEGRHRDPVKLGIALLGLGHEDEDRQKLKVLARHEEFTLYVAVALANSRADADRELFELAQVVDGWGRIELVQRLADTDDLEIKNWIFHEGFRNAVMDEYLAFIAATTGNLLERLRDDPGPETIDAACDIISALTAGGPAEDLYDYPDAAEAILALLVILEERASKLTHFVTVDDIEQLISRDGGRDEGREIGWTTEKRQQAITLCEEIKSNPQWQDVAVAGLESNDDREFYQAERTARALGHDTFAAHWRRVSADPIRGNWWALMQSADNERISAIIDLAESELPLDDIASGPGTSHGLGPEWSADMALGFIVQDLGQYPGHGWHLVTTALKSQVIRNRNMAINALEEWGRGHWPAEAIAILERALEVEPDDRVRERLQRLVDGLPLDDNGLP